MTFSRSLWVLALSTLMLAGCEGTGTGRQLFGTPSSNTIASIKLSLPQAPNRAAGSQFIPLQVVAYDKYNNPITVQYNEYITLSSTSACEASFSFYQPIGSTATPAPGSASIATDDPNPQIGISFVPGCPNSPDPVTITASAVGVPNATVSF